jgi:hypothetical protein
MKTRFLRLAILTSTTLAMAGCVHFWSSGPPCVGNGCPSGTGGKLPSVAQQAAERPAPKTEQEAQTTDAAPAASDADAQNAPAQADANRAQQAPQQASPAVANNAQPNQSQQKPGRFTRMLEALHLHSKS